MKTRYERRRDQHSRVWRKLNKRRKDRTAFRGLIANETPKCTSTDVPDKQRSLLEQWVFLGIQKAKMLAAKQHEQTAPVQIPQKVMQRLQIPQEVMQRLQKTAERSDGISRFDPEGVKGTIT
jgi:hypothetical protein